MRRPIPESVAVREGVTDLITASRVAVVRREIGRVRGHIESCCRHDEFCSDCRDLWVIVDMLADEAADLERLDPVWLALMGGSSMVGIAAALDPRDAVTMLADLADDRHG